MTKPVEDAHALIIFRIEARFIVDCPTSVLIDWTYFIYLILVPIKSDNMSISYEFILLWTAFYFTESMSLVFGIFM